MRRGIAWAAAALLACAAYAGTTTVVVRGSGGGAPPECTEPTYISLTPDYGGTTMVETFDVGGGGGSPSVDCASGTADVAWFNTAWDNCDYTSVTIHSGDAGLVSGNKPQVQATSFLNATTPGYPGNSAYDDLYVTAAFRITNTTSSPKTSAHLIDVINYSNAGYYGVGYDYTNGRLDVDCGSYFSSYTAGPSISQNTVYYMKLYVKVNSTISTTDGNCKLWVTTDPASGWGDPDVDVTAATATEGNYLRLRRIGVGSAYNFEAAIDEIRASTEDIPSCVYE